MKSLVTTTIQMILILIGIYYGAIFGTSAGIAARADQVSQSWQVICGINERTTTLNVFTDEEPKRFATASYESRELVIKRPHKARDSYPRFNINGPAEIRTNADCYIVKP